MLAELKGFSPGTKFGLLAGNGDLPVRVAETLQAHGHEAYLARIEGEADAALQPFEGQDFKLVQIARSLDYFKKMGATHIIFAGGVRGRVNMREVRAPFSLWRNIPLVLKGLARGDDSLLAVVITVFEQHGFTIVGPHEILPEMVVFEGHITKAKHRLAQDNIDFAIQAALKVGALDIGQAVICQGKRILAVEGAEGTDSMILRIAQLRENGRLADNARPILAKIAKPKQDIRLDMPTIGPVTIENAYKVGLSMLCLGAGATLMMDPKKTVELAQKYELGLLGVSYESAMKQYEVTKRNV